VSFPLIQSARTFPRLLRWGASRFCDPNIPHLDRVLLVESGSRRLFEDLLPKLYRAHPEIQTLDLVTCYSGQPAGFDPARGRIFATQDWTGRAARRRLYQILRDNRYSAGAVICSGEPILARWKWALIWQVPAKYLVLNENGDYFWLDRANLRSLKRLAVARSGFSGVGAVTTIGRVLVFPLTLAYLLAYAAWVHLKRHLGPGRRYLTPGR
jgi:hypothetical protein